MSEPLGCSMAPSILIYGQDTGVNGSLQMPSLEPVCEEARLRSSNIDRLNHMGSDLSGYAFRDSMEHSSTESGLTASGYDAAGKPRGNQNDSKQHLYYSSKQYYALPNPALNSSSSVGIASGKHSGKFSRTHSNPNNGGKSLRKFHLLHAFIPSVIFVVIAMAGTAVLIMESELEMFERVRNSPEMLSLRYQYYQPLKEFIIEKLGKKV